MNLLNRYILAQFLRSFLIVAAAFVAIYGSLLLASPLALATQRIRRLLSSGYTQADLLAALRAEVERRREELAYSHGVEPSTAEQAALAAQVPVTPMAPRLSG